MGEAQDILQQLHEDGASDTSIAALTGLSRGAINRIRHGAWSGTRALPRLRRLANASLGIPLTPLPPIEDSPERASHAAQRYLPDVYRPRTREIAPQGREIPAPKPAPPSTQRSHRRRTGAQRIPTGSPAGTLLALVAGLTRGLEHWRQHKAGRARQDDPYHTALAAHRQAQYTLPLPQPDPVTGAVAVSHPCDYHPRGCTCGLCWARKRQRR